MVQVQNAHELIVFPIFGSVDSILVIYWYMRTFCSHEVLLLCQQYAFA